MTEVLRRLVSEVRAVAQLAPRVAIGIDGPDAAGKTTLADRLAVDLAAWRASIDDFLRPNADRYRRGELSPEGYYLDSFDLPEFTDGCVRPFLDGACRISAGRRDPPELVLPREPAILIVDGVFLLRPELATQWTLSVYLRVSPQETLRRALDRDRALFGSPQQVRRRYLGRYLPGQTLYRAVAQPESAADIVLDNERPEAPTVRRWH